MTAPVTSWPTARGRVRRVARQVVAQASAASLTTPDLIDRVPPGTLGPPSPAGAGGRRRPVRRGRRRGPPPPVVVILVLMGLIIAGMGIEYVTGVRVLPSVISAGGKPPPRSFPVLDASRPVGISIGRIGLDAPVHEVGIAPDGAIAAPTAERAQEVGWYGQSPTPGQYGPAVLVGHVDTRTGPAVFHELGKLRAGDRIEVTRVDGAVAVFEVDSVSRYDKTRLPVAEVYEDFSRPGLRLITCGGRWVGGRTGYADNIVVFASLVASRPAR